MDKKANLEILEILAVVTYFSPRKKVTKHIKITVNYTLFIGQVPLLNLTWNFAILRDTSLH